MGKNERQRKGRFAALKTTVGPCVARFRDRQRQCRGEGPCAGERASDDASARDLVLLGRLAYHWESIAGKDLRRFVYPTRLFRGRLTVMCADSQWFQTLTFLKPAIQANIQRILPEAGIHTIHGQLGSIPAVARVETTETWPDWLEKTEVPLPEIGNPDLVRQIQTCRRKLRARLDGLTGRGYHLCPACGFNLIPREVGTCSICCFRARQQDLARARSLLLETPWTTFAEVRSQIPGLQQIEFDALRSDLLGEALKQVQILGGELRTRFNGADYMKMRYEMIRAVLFQTGLAPNLIDLDDPDGRFLLDPSWKSLLELSGEEEAC